MTKIIKSDLLNREGLVINGDYPRYKQIMEMPNRAERLVAALADYISQANLKEGDKLPSEKDLCDIFGVGTRSLREALIALRTLGLVQSKQGTGWIVEQFDPSSSLRFISVIIRNFTKTDLDQIMMTRLATEPIIAYLAAQNISDEGLENLKQVLQVMIDTDSDATFRFNDRKFHDILSQECDNNILSMVSSMLTGLFYIGHLAPARGDYDNVIAEHQKIFTAIKDKNPEAAETAMKEHLIRARQYIYEHHENKQLKPLSQQ
jgi:GntR family transcriptional repressor for pyruvate dehydrogenase complex